MQNRRELDRCGFAAKLGLLTFVFGMWALPGIRSAAAAEITLLQPEFLVNTQQTLGRQSHPTIAMNADGLMLVAWSTQTYLAEDIKARAFYADGSPWTQEFPVNTIVRWGTQHSPDVATNGGSRWVAVWASWLFVNEHHVWAKLYSSSKTDRQYEFSVDADALAPSTTRTRPDAAMFPNGDFIVIWDRTDPGGSELTTYVRLFDGFGNPRTQPIRINETASIIPPEDSTGTPDIAVREIDGQMVAFAAWGCWKNPAAPVAEVRCRRFDLHAMTFGDEFLISPPAPLAHQGRPTLDINAQGDILVTWQEVNPADLLYDIHTRKYTAADSAWGGLLDPPGNLEFEQHRAQGLLSEDGGIVLAWTRTHPQISDDIFLQMYDAAGAPLLADIFQVNTTYADVQRRPGLAMLQSGGNAHIGIVWESSVGDGDTYGIFGAVLDFDGFADFSVKAAAPIAPLSPSPLPAGGWDLAAAAARAGSAGAEAGTDAAVLRGHGAHPNPFNPSTRIRFELGGAQTVTLVIHDAAGRRVASLLAGAALGPGSHEVAWNGCDDEGRPAASGTYFYRLQAGTHTAAGRLTLVK